MKKIIRIICQCFIFIIPVRGFSQAGQLIYNGQFSGSGNQVLSGATLTFNSGSALQLQFGSPAANKLLYLTNSSGNVSWVGLGSGLSISGGNLVAGSSSSANPSATIGLSAVNGSATSFMTSDSAPALSQAIVPTWTGLHTFSITSAITSGSDYGIKITPTLNQRNATNFSMIYGNETVTQAGTGNQYLEELAVGGTDEWVVNSSGTLSSGTWNGSVIGSSYGGAGTVNGVLGANGSGTVSAATAGTGISLTTGPATISLAAIATGSVLGNTTGISAAPTATTVSSLLDSLGTEAQGDIAYRGSSGWALLAPGTSGQALITGGSAANPSWSTVGGPATTTAHDVASYSNSTGAFEDTGIASLANSQLSVTSSLTGANAPLFVENSHSSTTTPWLTEMLVPNLTAGSTAETINIWGVALASNNSAYLGFRYQGSGSSSNTVNIGFYGTNDVFGVSAAGNIIAGSGTDAGTGVLQIPASTSASSGIVFGGDTPKASIYRTGTSALATPASWAVGGKVAIAGSGISSAADLEDNATQTNWSGTYYGFQMQPQGVQTSGSFSGSLYGISVSPIIAASNTQNWTGQFSGITANPTIASGATGTITQARAGDFYVSLNNTSGTLSTAYGVLVRNHNTAGATITDSVGVAIASETTGSNNTDVLFGGTSPASGNYGLYQEDSYSDYFGGKFTEYASVATAGWGIPAVYAHGRQTAQTGADSSVATYTVGSSDGSFIVSANVNVTASTTHSFTVTCTYTDETNTSRVLTLGFTQLAGATVLSSITNVTGTGPYTGLDYHIRCKASTSITIATTGTFTSVTYNVEGTIIQIG